VKILFVVEHYHPFIGGAETLFKTLAEGLVKKGHDVTVITSSLPNTKKTEELNGVLIYRVAVPQFGRRYWFTFLSDLDVLWFAKRADIIQTTTYNGAWPAWFASKVLNKPCVITVHEVLGETWDLIQSPIVAVSHKFAERAILKLGFDKYVAVSNSTKRDIQRCGVDYQKVQTIYNGVDYQHFKPCEPSKKRDKFTYAYFGRYGITKGVNYLVKAAGLVNEQIPNSECHIYTKGFLFSNDFKRLFNGGYLSNSSVKICQPVDYSELPSTMASMDCIVIPSLSEGFGYTAAEACAVGAPVVATCVGSLPEVVSGKHVFCVPRDPRSLAEAIVKVYKGEYSSSPLKRFEWNDCVNQYEQLYQDLICGR